MDLPLSYLQLLRLMDGMLELKETTQELLSEATSPRGVGTKETTVHHTRTPHRANCQVQPVATGREADGARPVPFLRRTCTLGQFPFLLGLRPARRTPARGLQAQTPRGRSACGPRNRHRNAVCAQKLYVRSAARAARLSPDGRTHGRIQAAGSSRLPPPHSPALPPFLSRSRAGGGSSGLVPGSSGPTRSCRPRGAATAAARLHGAARDRRRSHGDGAAVSARP